MNIGKICFNILNKSNFIYLSKYFQLLKISGKSSVTLLYSVYHDINFWNKCRSDFLCKLHIARLHEKLLRHLPISIVYIMIHTIPESTFSKYSEARKKSPKNCHYLVFHLELFWKYQTVFLPKKVLPDQKPSNNFFGFFSYFWIITTSTFW